MLQRFPRFGGFVLLVGVLFLYLGYQTHRALRQAPAYTQNPDYDAEERIYAWLASAHCAQQSRTFLTLCTQKGGIIPIEDVALGDDRGHALFLDLFARTRAAPVSPEDLTAQNILINAFAVGAVALAFAFRRMPVAMAFALYAGTRHAIPGPIPGPDAPASYIGVILLAIVPVVLWPKIISTETSTSKKIATFSYGWVCLAFACLLREPVGLIGILGWLSFGIILAAKAIRTSLNAARPLVIALPFILMTALASPAVLLLRNTVYQVPPARHVAMHGISQTLFHGLGTEPNPWGIQWADSYGLEFVKRIDPRVGYLTPAYQRILSHQYWDIVWHHPFDVLHIYAVKAGRILALPFRIAGLNLFLVAFLLVVGVLVGCVRAGEKPRVRESMECAIGLALTSFFFLLQGVIGIPWANHLYPIKLLLLLIVGCLLESAWQWKKPV